MNVNKKICRLIGSIGSIVVSAIAIIIFISAIAEAVDYLEYGLEYEEFIEELTLYFVLYIVLLLLSLTAVILSSLLCAKKSPYKISIALIVINCVVSVTEIVSSILFYEYGFIWLAIFGLATVAAFIVYLNLKGEEPSGRIYDAYTGNTNVRVENVYIPVQPTEAPVSNPEPQPLPAETVYVQPITQPSREYTPTQTVVVPPPTEYVQPIVQPVRPVIQPVRSVVQRVPAVSGAVSEGNGVKKIFRLISSICAIVLSGGLLIYCISSMVGLLQLTAIFGDFPEELIGSLVLIIFIILVEGTSLLLSIFMCANKAPKGMAIATIALNASVSIYYFIVSLALMPFMFIFYIFFFGMLCLGVVALLSVYLGLKGNGAVNIRSGYFANSGTPPAPPKPAAAPQKNETIENKVAILDKLKAEGKLTDEEYKSLLLKELEK